MRPPRSSLLRVLLIEDNPLDQRLVQELAGTGPEPMALAHAPGVKQAVPALRRNGFDAILLGLDLHGGEEDVLALVREAAPDVPIVVLTTAARESDALAALRRGAQDYLVKEAVDGPALSHAVRCAIERQQVERGLRAAEARYRGLLEQLPLGVMVHMNGTIRLANQAVAHLLGYERADGVIGADIWPFVAPEDRERVKQYMQARLRGQPAPARYEVRVVRKGGAVVWLDCMARIVAWERESGFLVALMDATGRRQLDDHLCQLRKLEALRRQAASVADQFGPGLGVIADFGEVLLHGLDAPDPRRGEVEHIRRTALAAASLTGRLRAFSGEPGPEPAPISLHDVITEAEGPLRRLVGTNIRLITVLAPDEARILAEAGEIEQVIMLLAANARDAMPEGGTLTVETINLELDGDDADQHFPVHPGRWVMLVVSDTGHGMDEVTRARLFEPFFTTREPAKGRGFGLSTVYGIVQRRGGSILVGSEPSEGSSFTIYLPWVGAAAGT